jgi:hypothetical protein
VLAGVVDAPTGWRFSRCLVFWPGAALVVVDHVDATEAEVLSHVPLAPGSRLDKDVLSWGTGELVFRTLIGERMPVACGREHPRDGWVGAGFGRAVPRVSVAVRAVRGRAAYAIHERHAAVSLTGNECTISTGQARITVKMPEAK